MELIGMGFIAGFIFGGVTGYALTLWRIAEPLRMERDYLSKVCAQWSMMYRNLSASVGKGEGE